MSHVRFLARGIKFDRSCGVFEATFELQCKPLIPEPLITNNDPLLIKPQTSAPLPLNPLINRFPPAAAAPVLWTPPTLPGVVLELPGLPDREAEECDMEHF